MKTTMKAFISAASTVLSLLSISLPVNAMPTDKRDDSDKRLAAFTAAYGSSLSDEPTATSMKEINGKSNDINHGFGGDYVWIVINHADLWHNHQPICDFYFKNANCALMVLSSIPWDLAKGAGGNCRWLVPETLRCGTSGPWLTDAALWRAPGATTTPPSGWSYVSADLNGGRGGDYLYIVSR